MLIGGINIMSGHLTAEQLTKFLLYSEWLIYSTFWVGDNWSSLMQSIGASEKVFNLIDLLPSNQFSEEGITPSHSSVVVVNFNVCQLIIAYLLSVHS